MRNKIPIRNAGASIINDARKEIYNGSISALASENIMWAMPAIMKAIPPTISYFHDIHRTTTKIFIVTIAIIDYATKL